MTTPEVPETTSPAPQAYPALGVVPASLQSLELLEAKLAERPSNSTVVPLHPPSALLGKSLAPPWYDGTSALAATAHELPGPSRRLRLVDDSHGEVTYPEHSDCALVVHPDLETRMVLTHQLERMGYDVIAVSNSFRAVWALEHEAERICAVLVSTSLQQQDGSQLLRFIARRHPAVQRVLLTPSRRFEPANDVHPVVDHVVREGDDALFSLMAELFE